MEEGERKETIEVGVPDRRAPRGYETPRVGLASVRPGMVGDGWIILMCWCVNESESESEIDNLLDNMTDEKTSERK